jgi:hypothetical protein
MTGDKKGFSILYMQGRSRALGAEMKSAIRREACGAEMRNTLSIIGASETLDWRRISRLLLPVSFAD